jgi:hypothetical protein
MGKMLKTAATVVTWMASIVGVGVLILVGISLFL